jgi:phospholipid/cholesterol/gamma-HCH transport system substrate-binding protein
MRAELPVRTRALIGAAGLVGMAGAGMLAVQYGNGEFADGYDIEAVFSSSGQGLYDGSDVKVRGVNVGTVDGIELDERGRAVVTMFLDPGVEIPEGSTAAIEPLSVFGPKYIRITPPAEPGPALPEGGAIEETVDPVEFTLVLSDATRLLQAIEPRDLLTITESLSVALGGMGETIGRTVDHSEVALGSVDAALPSMSDLLRDLTAVAETLDERGVEIVGTAESLGRVLPRLSERGDELAALLDRTSVLSRDVSAILRTNAGALDQTLRHLEPIADLLASRPADLIAVVRMLDTQFGLLGDILRIEAEDGSLTAATRGNTRDGLCDVFPSLPCVPLAPPEGEPPAPPGPGLPPLPPVPPLPPLPPLVPGVPLPIPDPDIVDMLGLRELL